MRTSVAQGLSKPLTYQAISNDYRSVPIVDRRSGTAVETDLGQYQTSGGHRVDVSRERDHLVLVLH
jgi:hypothetical protein